MKIGPTNSNPVAGPTLKPGSVACAGWLTDRPLSSGCASGWIYSIVTPRLSPPPRWTMLCRGEGLLFIWKVERQPPSQKQNKMILVQSPEFHSCGNHHPVHPPPKSEKIKLFWLASVNFVSLQMQSNTNFSAKFCCLPFISSQKYANVV